MSRELLELAALMRKDWDRRISHDYRFWMSDGYATDEQMWESGERDAALLFRDLGPTHDWSALELGCGVGRLLRPALSRFATVFGLDVSPNALSKARDLLGAPAALHLVEGNGVDLSVIQSHSQNLVYSFASLTSIPTPIIARYLLEARRVLCHNGTIRLQMYRGRSQRIALTDTLHLRCFAEGDLKNAFSLAGFEVEWIEELKLPFQVSFKEVGIEAVILSARATGTQQVSPDELLKALLPNGGDEAEEDDLSIDLEAFMSKGYAESLIEQGDIERARQTLEYALAVSKTDTTDIRDLLDRLINKFDQPKESLNFFSRNLSVLSSEPRFQQIVCVLSETPVDERISVRSTLDGPVLEVAGLPLDHLEKPRRAAEVWVTRVLDNLAPSVERLFVYGFGSGYHLEELRSKTSLKIVVIESSAALLKTAFELRDFTSLLSGLDALVVGDDFAALQKLASAPDGSSAQAKSELLVRPQALALFAEHLARVKAVLYQEHAFRTLLPSIAVVGPMQGGTLPITSYTGKAIASLGQRVRVLDFSGFASGYHAVNDFTRQPVATLVLQNKYVEFLSQLVLEQHAERPFEILIAMAQAPLTPATLEALRKKGVITVLWFMEDFLRFTYWKQIAKYYDFVFTIQKGRAIEEIRAAGAHEVHYLPVGCDPQLHMSLTLTEKEKARWGSRVSFVGAGYHNRQQAFAALAHLPFKIWGTEWPEGKPFDRLVQEAGRRLTPEEYVKIFNATDINLNLHSSSERDGVDPTGDFVNPRTFELASSGVFQLVDSRSLLGENFVIGEEIETFSSIPEMKEKIDHYLDHPEERAKFAAKGRARALQDHSYQARLRSMLATIFTLRYEELSKHASGGPWARMIERASFDTELEARCQQAFKRGEEPNLDGLVADIVMGSGNLTETEQKLMFLFHVRKQTSQREVE